MIFIQLYDARTYSFSYLIADEKSRKACIIDPVLSQFDREINLLNDLNLTLVWSLETHLHADHITAASLLKESTQCHIGVPYGSEIKNADRYLMDSDTINLRSITISALATPGHTKNHLAFYINNDRILTGDALTIRGCGRTDQQGGNPATLYDSVIHQIFSLPADTLVYPGHSLQGFTCSTIDEEIKFNPRFKNKKHDFIQLMNNLNLPLPHNMQSTITANIHCGNLSKESIPA